MRWWWYYNATPSALEAIAAQNGARIERISTWGKGSQRRMSAILVNNANALTSRVSDISRKGTVKFGGSSSIYLKQVGGPVLASLNATKPHEPASSLKALHLYAAAKDIDVGLRDASDMIAWSAVSSNSTRPAAGCIANFPPNTQIQLDAAMRQMMVNSDNRTTEAIRLLYGYNGLNQTAADLGLESTRLNHQIGCAPGNQTRNRLSTKDIAKLYESVHKGTDLGITGRNAFWNSMSSGRFGINSIITEEINSYVNSMSGLTAAQKTAKRTQLSNEFRTKVIRHWKGGSYTFCGSGGCSVTKEVIRSRGSRVQIPVMIRGKVVTRTYVSGVFTDRNMVSSDAQESEVVNAFTQADSELFRDVIRSSLRTFK